MGGLLAKGGDGAEVGGGGWGGEEERRCLALEVLMSSKESMD